MNNWKKVLLSPSTSILDVIKVIDESNIQISIIVDGNDKLIGTVTDGDIRRGILNGVPLSAEVSLIMNKTPTTVKQNENRENIFATMKSRHFKYIPVVDSANVVVGLEVMDELISENKKDNWVFLMAGGIGTRLQPLTSNCPKPLLKIGNKPIVETILESFIAHGFSRFFISVNYKAEMIEDHFGNGEKWGVKISYIRENLKMGTAGSLSLLPEYPSKPIIVMNGDLLTKVNFQQLLDFHIEHRSSATMCVREYDLQVPYGVVNIESYSMVNIEEKPVHKFFVNGGIYVLNPEVLKFIPTDSYIDMPVLFQKLIDNKYPTSAFPIREYWLDIGRIDDFVKANGEYTKNFE